MYQAAFNRIGYSFVRTEFFKNLKPTNRVIFISDSPDGKIAITDYTESTEWRTKPDRLITVEEFVKEFSKEGTTVKDFWDAIHESVEKTYFELGELDTYLQSLDLYNQSRGIMPVLNGRYISFIPNSRYKRLFPFLLPTIAKYRTNMTIGKFLRYMNPELSDAKVEDIGNRIRAKFLLKDFEFEIVTGEEIRRWYHEDNTAPMSVGSLANSCMRYDDSQSFLDLYVDNPEVCRMLIARHKLGIIGRALLWETDKGTVMDRVYGSDSLTMAFLDYATKQGWDYVFRSTEDYTVQLKYHRYQQYPYLDSFCYLKDNTLSTYTPAKPYLILQSGEGDADYIELSEALLTVRNGDEIVFQQMVDTNESRLPMYHCLPITWSYTLSDELGINDHTVSGVVDMEVLQKWKEALSSGEYHEHESPYFIKRSTAENGEQTFSYDSCGVLFDILIKDGKLNEWEWTQFPKQIRKGYVREYGSINGIYRRAPLDIMRKLHPFAWNDLVHVQRSFSGMIDTINQKMNIVMSEMEHWSG